jgi:hypothetical protein
MADLYSKVEAADEVLPTRWLTRHDRASGVGALIITGAIQPCTRRPTSPFED